MFVTLELTDWCSLSLYGVDGEARRITNTESLIRDADILDDTRTHDLLHSTVALLCPVQFVDVNRPLASNTETHAGSLPYKSCADERAAAILLQLCTLDLVILQHC